MCNILSFISKSNSSHLAINTAQSLVQDLGDLSVPLHLRNAPTSLMKELDYGKNYNYSHDHEDKLHLQDFYLMTLKESRCINLKKIKGKMITVQ